MSTPGLGTDEVEGIRLPAIVIHRTNPPCLPPALVAPPGTNGPARESRSLLSHPPSDLATYRWGRGLMLVPPSRPSPILRWCQATPQGEGGWVPGSIGMGGGWWWCKPLFPTRPFLGVEPLARSFSGSTGVQEACAGPLDHVQAHGGRWVPSRRRGSVGILASRGHLAYPPTSPSPRGAGFSLWRVSRAFSRMKEAPWGSGGPLS